MGSFDGYFRNERGVKYDRHALELSRRWFSAHWSILSGLAPLPPAPRVLELGSALGTLYSFLPAGVRYTGLEVDAEAAEYARRAFPDTEFLEVPVEEFESPPETFDAVYATEVLEHLENPSAALRRLYALLKPGGFLVGTTPPPLRSALFDPTHLSVLAPLNWQRLFRRSGFEITFTGVRSFPPALWRLHPALNKSAPFPVPLPRLVVTMFFSCVKPLAGKPA